MVESWRLRCCCCCLPAFRREVRKNAFFFEFGGPAGYGSANLELGLARQLRACVPALVSCTSGRPSPLTGSAPPWTRSECTPRSAPVSLSSRHRTRSATRTPPMIFLEDPLRRGSGDYGHDDRGYRLALSTRSRCDDSSCDHPALLRRGPGLLGRGLAGVLVLKLPFVLRPEVTYLTSCFSPSTLAHDSQRFTSGSAVPGRPSGAVFPSSANQPLRLRPAPGRSQSSCSPNTWRSTRPIRPATSWPPRVG